ncbi:hypothetical protein Hanom_Chr03g00244841 [Helianthus anomalus]
MQQTGRVRFRFQNPHLRRHLHSRISMTVITSLPLRKLRRRTRLQGLLLERWRLMMFLLL